MSRQLPKTIREVVRERDGELCRLCGSNSRVEIHHKIPYIFGGTHDLENLITLCKSCHRCVENGHMGFTACMRLKKMGKTEAWFWVRAFELGLIVPDKSHQSRPPYHKRVLASIIKSREGKKNE